MANENPEKTTKKKKKRRKKHYFLRLLIIIAFIVGVIVTLRSSLFNVRYFEVQGNNYYTAAQVQDLAGLSTGINTFKQKLAPAKEALIADPYIKNVSINRKLPNTVVISIEERAEYACVPFENQYALIDCEGTVLRMSAELPVLPLLDFDRTAIVTAIPGKALEVEQSYLLTNTLALLDVMNQNDLYFKKINFSAVTVKAYIYDDLYCEGTPEHITKQMPLIKKLVEEQFQQGINKGVIKVGKDNYIAFSPKLDN